MKAKTCPCGRPLGVHAVKHCKVWYCFTCSLRFPSPKNLSSLVIARFMTLCGLQNGKRSRRLVVNSFNKRTNPKELLKALNELERTD